jgi:hypothetical protein
VTIFDLDRQVVNEYDRFARSFTTIRADDLRSQLQQAYAGRRFWPEPMIQINPRFKEGGSVGQLVASGAYCWASANKSSDALVGLFLKLPVRARNWIMASIGVTFVVKMCSGSLSRTRISSIGVLPFAILR